MRKSKLWGVILASVLLIGLSSCGGNSSSNTTQQSGTKQNTTSAPVQSTKAPSTTQSADDLYSKYLTAADVEKVSGFTGVKLVPYDPSKGAGGNLNFANSDGAVILIFSTYTANTYKTIKEQKGFVHSSVTGFGDEAFDGPEGPVQYVFFFRKGNTGASFSSFFDLNAGGKLFFSMDQLKQLAKIVEGRL